MWNQEHLSKSHAIERVQCKLIFTIQTHLLSIFWHWAFTLQQEGCTWLNIFKSCFAVHMWLWPVLDAAVLVCPIWEKTQVCAHPSSIINSLLSPLQDEGLTQRPPTAPILRRLRPFFAAKFSYFFPPSSYPVGPPVVIWSHYVVSPSPLLFPNFNCDILNSNLFPDPGSFFQTLSLTPKIHVSWPVEPRRKFPFQFLK